MTPEERAAKIIWTFDGRDGLPMISVFGWPMGRLSVQADVIVRDVRNTIAAHIELACAEYLSDNLAAVSPEGPVSEEREKEIRSGSCHVGVVQCGADRRDAVAIIDHQRALLARIFHDSDQYAAGLERGQRGKAKMLEVLREVEWMLGHYGNRRRPSCDGDKTLGHRDDCKLAAILKENNL